MFDVSSKYTHTSYGIPYDFSSVMHYDSTFSARRYGLKTMTAKVNPAVNDAKMGEKNGLAQSDVDVLNRMYCTAPDCIDKNVDCGMWALQKKCYKDGTRDGWMAENCQKSCAFCRPTIGATAETSSSEEDREEELDGLQDIFPNISKEVIRDVLEAKEGDRELAVGALIEMSKPKPEPELDELQEMFPIISKEVIRDVLKANRGNKDSAGSTLLEMTN